MEGFRIDLKTFLGLAKPNQHSQSVRKQISSWFWGDNSGQNPQTFMIPIYIVLLYYMIVGTAVGSGHDPWRNQPKIILKNHLWPLDSIDQA